MVGVPIIIINRDLVTWPKKMVEEIRSFSFVSEIIIIDNNSSSKSVLDWYASENFEVVSLQENLGHQCVWKSNFLDNRNFDYYIVTDPDLDLSQTPKDCVEKLYQALNEHKNYTKIGLSLSNFDVSQNSPYYYHLQNWKEYAWNPNSIVGNLLTEQIVDTTFAIYNHSEFELATMNLKSCCLNFPYSARHIPWEYTNSQLNNLQSENFEYFYYLENANRSSSFKFFTGINQKLKKMKKNKIVSSVYKLSYINQRGSGVYKGIDLLTQTIRNIIFDEYEYVIYTDKSSFDYFNLSNIFPQENVTIKIRELNSEYYLNYLNPIKNRRVGEGEIWDRIHSVENYIEVIYNKIEFLLEECKNFDGNVIWIDAGLFGTSCSNAWRDYMNLICHTKNFVDSIFHKITNFGFFALKGNHILMNYSIKEKLNSLTNQESYIVPGALFGGSSEIILQNFSNYKKTVEQIINYCGEYTSEQELLYVLLHDKNCKFFEFNDWDDFQKAILKIMDLYEPEKYLTNSMENYGIVVKNHTEGSNKITLISKDEIKKMENLTWTNLADLFGTDKGTLHEGHLYTTMYEKHLSTFIDKNPCFVEIGINDSRFPGGCIKFWDMIFDKMTYYGLDIVDCSHFEINTDKFKIIKCDQGNDEELKNFINTNNLINNIDVVIDDGSHILEDIMISLKTIYPNLVNGGKYMIESVHAGQSNYNKLVPLIESFLESSGFSEMEIYKNKMIIITK